MKRNIGIFHHCYIKTQSQQQDSFLLPQKSPTSSDYFFVDNHEKNKQMLLNSEKGFFAVSLRLNVQ